MSKLYKYIPSEIIILNIIDKNFIGLDRNEEYYKLCLKKMEATNE